MNPNLSRSCRALSRRDFLGCAAAAGVLATVKTMPACAAESPSAAASSQVQAHAVAFGRDWAKIRGFNYQPSYGSSGFELWQKFDAPTIDVELGRGKKYFPHINAIRFWLSWDSFNRNPKQFAANFEAALAIAAKYQLVVLPTLFNRWHSQELDYGGIYADHFLPGASWIQSPTLFNAYMEAIVGGHKDDARILAWDLCNEPYAYNGPRENVPDIVKAETAWLKGLYDQCKKLGAKAPITVGIHPGVPLELTEPISDILSVHPYWSHNSPNASKAEYEQKLDADVTFANRVQKPLLATECCWGSLDDAVRVDSIRYTLTQLKKRNLGWLAYILHHSLIADAHRPEFGPLGDPGNLAFIEADGSLRPGHDVFNEFP
jgi:hypothetical protein